MAVPAGSGTGTAALDALHAACVSFAAHTDAQIGLGRAGSMSRPATVLTMSWCAAAVRRG